MFGFARACGRLRFSRPTSLGSNPFHQRTQPHGRMLAPRPRRWNCSVANRRYPTFKASAANPTADTAQRLVRKPPPPSTRLMFPKLQIEETKKADPSELFVKVVGSGDESVLLLHGLGETYRYWYA